MVLRIVVFALLIVACRAQCQNGIMEMGVSPTDEQTIVNRHNALRTMLAMGQVPNQPKASNMQRMSYDEALGRAAQTIADTCVFRHVAVNDTRFSVGQNIYTWSSTGIRPGANWTQAIDAWWDEHRTYVFSNQNYNHYTQEAWATTNLVGCGYSYFRNSRRWYQKIYVCNYGPAGNIVGQYPYMVGPGCENLCEP